MKTLEIPEFKTYEEEAGYWDHLDTAPVLWKTMGSGFNLTPL